jgi:hypothetical protein
MRFHGNALPATFRSSGPLRVAGKAGVRGLEHGSNARFPNEPQTRRSSRWRPSVIRPVLALLIWLAAAAATHAHVVTQLYAEWHETERSWELEIQFEAGYAEPSIRENPTAPAPDREWLLSKGAEGWKPLRAEAERYLRECLVVRVGNEAVKWSVEFPDFSTQPPDFPKLLTNGAYMRMIVRPDGPPSGPVSVHWTVGGNRPTLVLKADREQHYLSFNPGDTHELANFRGSLRTSFAQGFLHVLPLGWDHVLFVLGLFFYRRKWKPLLHQSLAFTTAHTVTLGLAAGGLIQPPGPWVEPLIALSLAAVALENFRAHRERNEFLRLAVVFGFGLIHGLGFAGALSSWLKPGEGFLAALLSANLGVEAAQAVILAGAWILTIGWHDTKAGRIFRNLACLGIAAVGLIWTIQRMG